MRWGWDAPLVASLHGGATTRLYFAGSRVYRGEERGASWTPISGDLRGRRNRDTMKLMGRTWPADAVGRKVYTTPLSVMVSLAELSPGCRGRPRGVHRVAWALRPQPARGAGGGAQGRHRRWSRGHIPRSSCAERAGP